MVPLRVMLETLAARDPDGWETREPTGNDRALFRAWAIHTYGLWVWDRYIRTSWAEEGRDV